MSHPFITTSVNAMTMVRISGIIQELNDVLNENQPILVSDFYKIIGIQTEKPYIFEYGWKNLEGMTVTFKFNLYTLDLPEPERLKKNFDPSKYELTIKIRGDHDIAMAIGDSLDNPKYSIRKDHNDFNKAYDYAFNRISKECERRHHESIS